MQARLSASANLSRTRPDTAGPHDQSWTTDAHRHAPSPGCRPQRVRDRARAPQHQHDPQNILTRFGNGGLFLPRRVCIRTCPVPAALLCDQHDPVVNGLPHNVPAACDIAHPTMATRSNVCGHGKLGRRQRGQPHPSLLQNVKSEAQWATFSHTRIHTQSTVGVPAARTRDRARAGHHIHHPIALSGDAGNPVLFTLPVAMMAVHALARRPIFVNDCLAPSFSPGRRAHRVRDRARAHRNSDAFPHSVVTLHEGRIVPALPRALPNTFGPGSPF